MANNNLTFIETLTVEQFKRKHGVDSIKVKQNPHTGKLFFTFGAKTGAVAVKGIPQKPMLSYVQGEKTVLNPDGKFWMLHEEGTGGAPVLATF